MSSVVLQQLMFARQIANYADKLGVYSSPPPAREPSDHLGAVLADAILQAGVSYRTVVRSRVDRICSIFPETATLPGLMEIIEKPGASHFLLWTHSTKLTRFTNLVHFLASRHIATTMELRHWLPQAEARQNLLELHGIGPKTYDYLCCLVGIDSIAVDRHVRTFATEAGVYINDYEGLRIIVSYAADLLGLARRDFDSWIWRTVSQRATNHEQLPLI